MAGQLTYFSGRPTMAGVALFSWQIYFKYKTNGLANCFLANQKGSSQSWRQKFELKGEFLIIGKRRFAYRWQCGFSAYIGWTAKDVLHAPGSSFILMWSLQSLKKMLYLTHSGQSNFACLKPTPDYLILASSGDFHTPAKKAKPVSSADSTALDQYSLVQDLPSLEKGETVK